MVDLNSIFQRLVLREASARCPPARTGRPRELTDAVALQLMFRVVRTGMQWREISTEISYTTVLRRMATWRDAGVFRHSYEAALRTFKKLYPTQYYCVDSAYVKNAYSSECVGRNHTDRGRKAMKLSALVDQTGMPHGIACHPGNRPDVTLLGDSIRACMVNLERCAVYADKGYDSRANRRLCETHHLRDRIFRRRTKTTRRTNARRVVVEHTFAWIKKFRRLLYMYERSPGQFMAFAFLAFGHLMCVRMQPSIMPCA